MSFRSFTYFPNDQEYLYGSTTCSTGSHMMTQYQLHNRLHDVRKGDVPSEKCNQSLYLRQPRMGMPEYRATFRDKPFNTTKYYPCEDPHNLRDYNNKLTGFHGRIYDDGKGSPKFKYEGRRENKLFWLERYPYACDIPDVHKRHLNADFQTIKAEYKRTHFPRVNYRNYDDYVSKTRVNYYPHINK